MSGGRIKRSRVFFEIRQVAMAAAGRKNIAAAIMRPIAKNRRMWIRRWSGSNRGVTMESGAWWKTYQNQGEAQANGMKIRMAGSQPIFCTI